MEWFNYPIFLILVITCKKSDKVIEKNSNFAIMKKPKKHLTKEKKLQILKGASIKRVKITL